MNIVDHHHHRGTTANAGTTTQNNDNNSKKKNINEMKQKFRKFLVNLGPQQQTETETETETKTSGSSSSSHQKKSNKNEKQIIKHHRAYDYRDDDDDDDDDKTIPSGYYRNRNQNQHLPPLSSALADHEDGISSILFHSQHAHKDYEDYSDFDDDAGGDNDYSDVDEDYDIERELMERFSQQFVVNSLRFSLRDDYDLQDYHRYDDGYGTHNNTKHDQKQRHRRDHRKKQTTHQPESKLESCLDLLSSTDLDQNRLGLQRLNLLTKGRALSSLHRSEELASFAIIYGTTNIGHEDVKGNDGKYYHIRNHPGGSIEERLRYVFATFICDAPHDDTAMINKSSFMNLPFVMKNDEIDDDDSATFSVYYDDGDDEKGEWGEYEFGQDIDEHVDDEGYDDDFFQELDRLVNLSDLTKQQQPEDEDDEFPQAQTIIEEEYDQTTNGSSETEDSDEDGITGKAWGALHNQALRVLANALSQITPSPYYSTNDDNDDGDDDVQRQLEADLLLPHIPLGDTIWRNIIQTLVRNIRNNPNADITGHSLKIVKMLHTLHPDYIQPLLSQTLFPHLIHLAEYGEGHRFPVIHQEATALLKRAKATTTTTN
mmetsp:Transcript_126/g.217  ORF Transcript_126/g.217 Transcript_126/m.217 type:complete len:599 (+) Transcript_126:362-2158(+)